MIAFFWAAATVVLVSMAWMRMYTDRDISTGEMGIAVIAYCVVAMVRIERQRRDRATETTP
jgi:hypothetical protein